jgi:alpha-tubulin suppressor-like RCC1 family protein
MPLEVSGGLAWRDVATGAESACGVTTTGDVYCWGRNDSGQLGDGTTTERRVPTLVVMP